jgi:hypothetical protein
MAMRRGGIDVEVDGAHHSAVEDDGEGRVEVPGLLDVAGHEGLGVRAGERLGDVGEVVGERGSFR